MIYIGTDIVPISRIEKIIEEKKDRFLDHIFTVIEQRICNNKATPSIHYSGKFAAKEAIKKALLSSKRIKYISLKSIEIQNDDLGAPVIYISSKDINIDPEKIKVSISHAGEYATSTAIIEL